MSTQPKTFHAFGAMLLRQSAEAANLSPNFAIASEESCRRLLKQSQPDLKEAELSAALSQISAFKNQLLQPDSPELVTFIQNSGSLVEPAETDFGKLSLRQVGQPAETDGGKLSLRQVVEPAETDGGKLSLRQVVEPAETDGGKLSLRQVADIYRQYEAVKRQNNLLDFDDLILQTVALFEEQPAVLQAYHDRFRWISVDEYQDINFAQYRLLRQLTGPQSNLCVIGDPDQAIYGFRGAKREYFLSFQQDYPDAQMMRLNQNYRSTQLILDASRQVIAKGEESQAAELWSEVVNAVKVDFYTAPTDKAEAEYVVHQMERMLGGTSYFSLDSGRVDDEAGGYGFGDFAVLYRLGAQASPLIEAIERSGMPYQVIGQRSLYEHQEIKTVLAYLWWLHTPQSVVHVEELLGFFPPEGLLQLPPTAWGNLMIKPTHQKRLRQIGPFLAELRKQADSESVTDLIGRVQAFLVEQGRYPTSEASAERRQKLIQRATPFAHDLTAFLETTALQKESDFYDPRADRVTLMTLHASKGLEFPVVFMVGCEEGLLPYQRAGEPTDVEEERRLFYVGMTRAQQKLILTQATSRFLFGQRVENEPSVFVGDIEAALKEIKKAAARSKSKSAKPDAGQQLSLF